MSRTIIQNAIIVEANQPRFPLVTYDKETKQAIIQYSQLRAPSSCICNETDSTFSTINDYGRAYVAQRVSWTFQLKLNFDEEVSGEKFEEFLIGSPMKLRTTPGNVPFIVELQAALYRHPPQQSVRVGSEITYTFTVRKFPR